MVEVENLEFDLLALVENVRLMVVGLAIHKGLELEVKLPKTHHHSFR